MKRHKHHAGKMTLSRERMQRILRSPVITEKATAGSEHGHVSFRVSLDATKPEIKAAVELLFKVKVESVQVLNVKGKEKRFGRFMGRRRNWKKAFVRIAQGQEINFAATE